MEMQDVEIVGAPTNAIEHQHVIRHDILNIGVKPKRLWHAPHEVSRSERIPARE